MVCLERGLVRVREPQQLRNKQREHLFRGFRHFHEFLFAGGKRELLRGGRLEVRDNPEDIGQHFGGEPAHLRDILVRPENLRVDGARAYQVERHLQ